MNEDEHEPFFIGWESNVSPSLGAFLKKTSLILVIAALAIAVVVPALQRTIGRGWFNFGNVMNFSGVLVKDPVPMLISDHEIDGVNLFYLVSEFKHGFPPELAKKHHLKQVTLRGTLISWMSSWEGEDSMIEVVNESVTSSGERGSNPLQESAGQQVAIRGEIVDSKCHLGAMNPGRFKPHRACAIRCIAGGIPPILVARDSAGRLVHYLLVGSDGSPVNDAVLDHVAEPVAISGILKIVGDRNVLMIDPSEIERLQ